MDWQPGNKVIWRHEMRGGYGYVERIPATVVSVFAKRVRIRVEMRRSECVSEIVERTVKPEHLWREV